MKKVALLIGVSEYLHDFKSLPAAVKDVDAMQEILQAPNIGQFDEVKTLINPERMEMEEEIEALFKGRVKDDLVFLFFSGHGIKDDYGKLFFATHSTRKAPNGELIKATAVPASSVHMAMEESRSKRQVVVLDCCFSGAFAEGLAAKDDGSIDLRSQLGGEGRAILTSSTSTQYSFEQETANLSIYTQYLVEGIKTGLADRGNDGWISVDELHEYAREKVREETTSMQPGIYTCKEGFTIHLAQAPITDPQARYRKEVERWVQQGEISTTGHIVLNKLREKLELSRQEAALIREEVLELHREHQQNLQIYRQQYYDAICQEHPLSEHKRHELKQLQQALALSDEDVTKVEEPTTLTEPIELVPPAPPSSPSLPPSEPASTKTKRFNPIAIVLLAVVGVGVTVGLGFVGIQGIQNPSGLTPKLSEKKVTPEAKSPALESSLNSQTSNSAPESADQKLPEDVKNFSQNPPYSYVGAILAAQKIQPNSQLFLEAKKILKNPCMELRKQYHKNDIVFANRYGGNPTNSNKQKEQIDQIKTSCRNLDVDFGA